MFEVKENQKVLPDGTQITTFTREVISTLVIEAEAGTTGFKGGGMPAVAVEPISVLRIWASPTCM